MKMSKSLTALVAMRVTSLPQRSVTYPKATHPTRDPKKKVIWESGAFQASEHTRSILSGVLFDNVNLIIGMVISPDLSHSRGKESGHVVIPAFGTGNSRSVRPSLLKITQKGVNSQTSKIYVRTE